MDEKRSAENNSQKPPLLFLAVFLLGHFFVSLVLISPLLVLFVMAPWTAFIGGVALSVLFAGGYSLLGDRAERTQLLLVALSIFYQYISYVFALVALVRYTGLESGILSAIVSLALVGSLFTFLFTTRRLMFLVSLFETDREKATEKLRRILKTPL
jgi:hypothetical protein